MTTKKNEKWVSILSRKPFSRIPETLIIFISLSTTLQYVPSTMVAKWEAETVAAKRPCTLYLGFVYLTVSKAYCLGITSSSDWVQQGTFTTKKEEWEIPGKYLVPDTFYWLCVQVCWATGWFTLPYRINPNLTTEKLSHFQSEFTRIDSQNILSWKEPTRILKSNCWLHKGSPKTFLLCCADGQNVSM